MISYISTKNEVDTSESLSRVVGRVSEYTAILTDGVSFSNKEKNLLVRNLRSCVKQAHRLLAITDPDKRFLPETTSVVLDEALMVLRRFGCFGVVTTLERNI